MGGMCPAPVPLCSEPSSLRWPHHHCPAQLLAPGLELAIFSGQHILLLEFFIITGLVIIFRFFLMFRVRDFFPREKWMVVLEYHTTIHLI